MAPENPLVMPLGMQRNNPLGVPSETITIPAAHIQETGVFWGLSAEE